MKRAKSSGLPPTRIDAVGTHRLADVIGLERLVGDTRQLVDHLARRACRRDQAIPQAQVVSGQSGFRHGRHVRGNARAPGRCRGDGLEMPFLDMGHHRQCRRKQQVDASGQQVDQRRRAAGIRNVQQLDVRHVAQQHAAQARHGEAAAAAIGDPIGLGFRQRDQLLQIVDADGRMSDQHLRAGRNGHDRREVLDRIVARAHRHRVCEPVGRQVQRVAVLGRARDRLGGKIAAGATLVLDHEALTERLGETLRQQPGRKIDRGAGREADDDANRSRGIDVGAGQRRRQRQRRDVRRRDCPVPECGHAVLAVSRQVAAALRRLRHLEQDLRQPVWHVDHGVVAARHLVDAPACPRLDLRLCGVERRVGIAGGADIGPSWRCGRARR